MTPTLALLGGIAVATATVAARSGGKATAMPAAEQVPPAEQQDNWQVLTVASLSDAERLLDHLEACGSSERELVILGDSSFAVRWR
jgi:hypothetical protein